MICVVYVYPSLKQVYIHPEKAKKQNLRNTMMSV